MLVFKEKGKLEYSEKNVWEQRILINYKLDPHMASTPGFEHGPHIEQHFIIFRKFPSLKSFLSCQNTKEAEEGVDEPTILVKNLETLV